MENKVYAILLAAGNGSRINLNIPKQYIEMNGLPLFFYPLKTFSEIEIIDKIILVINPNYNYDIFSLINKQLWKDKVIVINGGNTRHESLFNAIKYLKNVNIDNEDIVLTHDCARAFISKEIINNNIKAISLNECNVISTGIASDDTIASIKDLNIENVLDRENVFLEQTPQTARYKTFYEVYCMKKIDNEILKKYTDFCGLALFFNKKIKCVLGNKLNFKITNDFDLWIANQIIVNKKIK